MLRASDVRPIYRLLDECLQFGIDPDGWRHRLAAGVRRLFRARVVITGEFQDIFDEGKARALHAVDLGWASPEQQLHFIRYQLDGANGRDPLRAVITARRSSFVVCSLAEVTDFDAYRQSDVYRDYMGPAEIGDQLVAITAIGPSDGERWNMVTALRASPDAIFDARDRGRMRLLARELAGLVGSRLADSTSTIMKLTPREHQTLRLLLEGGSEAAIAEAMNLSPSTLHKYVVGLYRLFGVNSRAGLQALFAGRGRLSTEREKTADPRQHRVRREGSPMTKSWRSPDTIRRSRLTT